MSEFDIEDIRRDLYSSVRNYNSAPLLILIGRIIENQPSNPPYEFTSDFNLRAFTPDQFKEYVPEFIAAALADMAVRWSNVHRGKTISPEELYDLLVETWDYLRADPVIQETPPDELDYEDWTLYLLRIAGLQLPFQLDTYGEHARPLLMFDKLNLPALSEYDFERRFQEVFGVPLRVFIDVGFVTWTAARRSEDSKFKFEYYKEAKRQGANLPDMKIVSQALNNYIADPEKLRDTYDETEEYVNDDPHFQMYRFIPLLRYPVLHPWKLPAKDSSKYNRLISPLPDLIPHRMSEAVYYEFLDAFGKGFTDWFSSLFEEYCGHILSEAFTKTSIISESALREEYPEGPGKHVVDWVIVEDNQIALFECKSSRVSLLAKTSNSRKELDNQLEDLAKGMIQLESLKSAIASGAIDIPAFQQADRISKFLVTQESLYGVFSQEPGQNYMKDLIRDLEGIENSTGAVLDCHFITHRQLEGFQPHFSAGVPLKRVLKKIETGSPLFRVQEEIQEDTGRMYKHSFLHEADRAIVKSLGVEDIE